MLCPFILLLGKRLVKENLTMGRMILCPHCRSTFDEDILKKKNSINVCLVCGESLLGDNDSSEDDQSDWITWYYYGFKSDNGESCILQDEPIDLTQHGDIFFLMKEFKAPPRDSAGSADRAKKVLRTYYPNAFPEPKKEDTTVHCPFCGYHEFTLLNRGYSIFTGFLGSDKVKRICNRCKMQF